MSTNRPLSECVCMVMPVMPDAACSAEVEADFDNLYQQSSHAAWLEQWNCRQSSRVSGGSSAASHPEAARRRFVQDLVTLLLEASKPAPPNRQ